MGFTGFVYDLTPEAVSATRRYTRTNGDIIAHHIEGVPWAEALGGDPLPAKLLEEWEGKTLATPLGGKVYLALSPGRGELKVAEKAGPLPDELRNRNYDDPLVKQAFLNYCLRALEFFKPDFLAIGIEVNELHGGGRKTWQDYAELHRYVYQEIKRRRPGLPVFASFTLHNLYKQRGAMLAELRELLPFNDLLAVSYYPFFMAEPDRLKALDWLLETFGQTGKPFAFVETNDAGGRTPFPKSKLVIEGTPARQLAYYEKLLRLAQERHFVFVISFVHQDYDGLWDKIKTTAPEFFIAWRNCGLLDREGNPRPAGGLWQDYLALPLVSPGPP